MFEVERERSRRVASATFRISDGIYHALQREADKQDTSLNTLVNQLFDEHVKDRAFLEKLDFLRVSRLTFRRILEGTTDEVLKEAGMSSGKETVMTITLGKGEELNLETLLETICSLAEFAGGVRYSEIKSNGREIVVLTHDLGPKWSVFVTKFMEGALSLIGHEPKITTGADSVVVEVDSSREPTRASKPAWTK